MSWEAQLGADLLRVDGLQPATLERTDGTPPTTIAHALRRAIRTAEAEASGGKYTTSDTHWHLPSTELADAPRLGDRLIEGNGTAWTVLQVELLALGGSWRCQARNLAIAAGLDQQITIQRAAWTRDSAGAPVATWSDWRVNLAARVHPVAGKAIDAEARTQSRRRVQVFLTEAAPLDHNYRILQGAAVYRVLGYEGTDAIDRLTTLWVEPVEPATV